MIVAKIKLWWSLNFTQIRDHVRATRVETTASRWGYQAWRFSWGNVLEFINVLRIRV